MRGFGTPLTARFPGIGRPRGSSPLRRAAVAGLASLCLAAAVSACGQEQEDLVNGKQLFVEQCGTCHALERAGTSSTQGPNLDDAFGPARGDGLGEETVQGVVQRQISNVRRGSIMPEDLVSGADARDVAAYVATVAGIPGEDTGALAAAGLAGAEEPEQIFTAGGCGGCHTFAPAGTDATIGPSLDELAAAADQRVSGTDGEEYTEAAIVAPDEFVVQGFQAGTMPDNYGDQLDPKQLQTLVDYLLNPEG